MQLSLPELESELIELLRGQGLPIEDIRLIGLLGKGSRGTVFSVLIDGAYHVLKVYDSKESLRAELKNLRKMTPKDRFLFSWQETVEGSKLNLAIIEVPEGQELTSELLTEIRADQIAHTLAQLYAIRHRQKVSLTSLRDNLERQRDPFMQMIQLLGLNIETYEALFANIDDLLIDQAGAFRTRKVRIHGDLWWPNIIVAQEAIYLIDWESLRRGDAAEDIAKLRIVLYWPRGADRAVYFWKANEHRFRVAYLMKRIVEQLDAQRGDVYMKTKLRYYLPILCIQELGQRYLLGKTQTKLDMVKNLILAQEALNLFEDPLAPPPDLAGFIQAIQDGDGA